MRAAIVLALVCLPIAAQAQAPSAPIGFGDPTMRQAYAQAMANAQAAQLGLQQARRLAGQSQEDMAASQRRADAIGQAQQGPASWPPQPKPPQAGPAVRPQ
jgi:hypothetical protein